MNSMEKTILHALGVLMLMMKERNLEVKSINKEVIFAKF